MEKLIEGFGKVFWISSKELWLKKLEKWPSIILVLLEFCGVIFLLPTNIWLYSDSPFSSILTLIVGIFIFTFNVLIGSFIYEANKRITKWGSFWESDEQIEKKLTRYPNSCSFHIWIIRFIGIVEICIGISMVVGLT